MTTTDRGVRTRARLIKATTAVVRTQGYAAATTRTIAAAAGVSEATIYRHFPDKIALFFAAVVERHTSVIGWMAELPDRAGTATITENLAESLNQLAVLGADLAPLELAILADPELARRRNESDELPPGPPTYLAAYLRAEQTLGRIRADVEPDQIALVLLATLFGIVAGQVATVGPADTTLIDKAIEVIARGLAPSSAIS
jgi:AcrR family transcriptional regulator